MKKKFKDKIQLILLIVALLGVFWLADMVKAIENRPITTTYIPTPTQAPTPTWHVYAKYDHGHMYDTYFNYHDRTMATPEEVLAALNAYRAANGVGPLTMDPFLENWAQSRADYFQSIGDVDQHEGFLKVAYSYLNHPYTHLGENGTEVGGPLSGEHVVAVFGADVPHDETQKLGYYNVVGIGIHPSGIYAIDVIFGQK